MNDVLKSQIVQKARTYWENNQPSQAGGVIFESIPVNRRHLWAYEILNIAYPYFPTNHEIQAVLEFAKFPENWGEGETGRSHDAHKIVDEVNNRQNDPIIFRLATQVGKIVYTAQQYPAPFDHSAGWTIAEILKQIVQQMNNEKFETTAWLTLANEDFIILEAPVMCHPGCPTCTLNGLTPMSKGLSQKFIRKNKS